MVIEPPIALAVWSVLGIILLRQYPLEMTAEYVELATGMIFLATAVPLLELSRRTYLALGLPAVVIFAAASYQNLQDTFGSPQKLACAEADGTWLDFEDSGKTYGTAMALLVLSRWR